MHGRIFPPSARPGSEDGFGLIEVIVSAMLLAIVAVGVYAGLDSASATSGVNKGRAMATVVAQQDQERMRAYRASDLSNLRMTRTQMVASVPYTVVSRADWVTDSSGTASCQAGAARANYLKISSTVTWPGKPAGLAPVELTSLVAPPNGSFTEDQGSLAIQVRDRNGAGVPGLPVGLSGPESQTGTTNELGCVLWGFLTAGNYTASFSRAGWVDRQGNQLISQPVGVVGQQTNTAAFDYDQAGQITVTFDTQPVNLAVRAAKAQWLVAANSGLSAPGTRRFGNGTLQSSIAASSLFPFTDPYSIWSGDCQNQDPRTYGQPGVAQIVGPGGSLTATVRMPALNLIAKANGGLLAGANVRAYVRTPGCTGTYTTTTDAAGRPIDPGLPYGTYDVCVDKGGRKAQTITGVDAKTPAGTALLTTDINGAGYGLGACP